MIPVYINVFNRLTTTRNLCEQVSKLENADPVIIDNNSFYEPLLNWYENCPYEVIHLRENLGHHAPWKSGVVQQDESDFYIVTDCDLDLTGVPKDVISVLKEPFNWDIAPTIIKSGLALKIDDLPYWQQDVINWESRWWGSPALHDTRFYHALIDTTFAMYKQSSSLKLATQVVGSPAVRLAGDYQARHTPWYLDGDNLDEENMFYFNSANSSNSWKLNGRKLSSRN